MHCCRAAVAGRCARPHAAAHAPCPINSFTSQMYEMFQPILKLRYLVPYLSDLHHFGADRLRIVRQFNHSCRLCWSRLNRNEQHMTRARFATLEQDIGSKLFAARHHRLGTDDPQSFGLFRRRPRFSRFYCWDIPRSHWNKLPPLAHGVRCATQ